MGMTQSVRQISNMTPMLRQYFDLKNACPDSILFFRMGDFYEIFGDDAVEVSPLLNIVLTKRDKGEDSIPFCGVPHHSARTYWLKLLKMNYKIAIADQVEDPSQAKGLVRRELTKFLTPACVDDLEGIESDQPNFLMFVYEDPDLKIWIAGLADVSTGELRVGEFSSLSDLIGIVEIYRPKEILLRRFLVPVLKEKLSLYLAQNNLLFTPMPEAILRDSTEQKEWVHKVLGHPESFEIPIKSKELVYPVLAALFIHLNELKFSLGQFLNLSPLQEKERTTLNGAAIHDLELFTTARQQQQKGSLFNEINFCLTPMGTRLLRWNLAHPMLDAQKIERNHNWVSFFVSLGQKSLEQMRSYLDHVSDMERLLVKILSKSIKPKELSSIQTGLENVLLLTQLFQNLELESESSDFKLTLDEIQKSHTVFTKLENTLRKDIGTLGSGDEVFLRGFDKILDEKNDLSKNGMQKVEEYQDNLKKKTGISSLKIKEHKNFGLLIEVTKTHLSKAPETWIRRQTMVNCERFITVDLQELSDSLTHAKDDALFREECLYAKLLIELSDSVPELKKISNAIAQLDMHLSFAWLALQKKYCKPEIVSNWIKLKAVRHPTVENFVGAYAFSPNDLFLEESGKQVLITGPNMGGKSTIMRTVAICAILNQCGGFIPATSAQIPIFDQIFTRVGASDDLVKGLSTFMVEMTETACILRRATKNSLVILDEVGRGTSTEDGLAIASAVLENLATKVKAWTLFATHYHELVHFANSFSNVKTYQTEVIKKNDSIKFTHRLVEGASGSSYGVQVAKLAGIPDCVIERAHDFLQASRDPQKMVNLSRISKDEPSSKYRKFIRRLEEVSIDETTPVQALNILMQMKEELGDSTKKGPFPDGQSLF